MIPENIQDLARKFLDGTATEAETAALHRWYDEWKDEETIIGTDTESADAIELRMLSRIQEQIRFSNAPSPAIIRSSHFTWRKWVAAAAVIVLGSGLFIWKKQFDDHRDQVQLAAKDTITGIRPGIDKALLILNDGQELVLDKESTGVITKQGNTDIINQDGQLTYNGTVDKKEETTYYNIIKTGRGNQYQLILPDGTRAWLNAASSLRFPTRFNGNNRTVELTGEGYFEVAQNKSKPFKVLLPKNTGEESSTAVEVLGTHFNIMAYQDESGIKTSLLEGSVKVIQQSTDAGKKFPVRSALLRPGQELLIPFGNNHPGKITTDNFNISQGNVEEAVAWKNGYFLFTDAPITTVMRQAARWYDVEVSYQGNVQQEIFSGSIPRSANITQLIKILELTKTVKIRIEGRKLIVSPY